MRHLAIILISSAALAGCATTGESLLVEPQRTPVRSLTSFSNALRCVDETFLLARQAPISVVAEALQGGNAERSAMSKEMLIHALNQMSRRSQAVRYVDFDPEQVSSHSLLLRIMGGRGFLPPSYYIRGALAGERVQEDKKSVGLGLALGYGSYSKVESLTNLKLNLSLGRFRYEGKLVRPEVVQTASYTYSVTRVETGGRVSANVAIISDLGLSVSIGRTTTEGVYQALQSTLELGVIELLGRELGVPYWNCLSLESTTPRFQQHVHDWYEGTRSRERLRFAQAARKRAGYYKAAVDGIPGRATRAALTAYQHDHGLVPTGRLSLTFFLSLPEMADTAKVGGDERPTGPDGGSREPGRLRWQG
jgi:hypothetical protein